MGASLVIGLDIGASKMLAGLVTRAGELKGSLQVDTAGAPAGIMAAARALCQRLLDMAEAPVLAIGIGSAGIIDSHSGIVIHANDNLPGWAGTDLNALSIADLPIVAENDARAMAFGEATLGAGASHGYRSLLCLTVGTGIGGALILDGEVWHGANSSAGEIGYLVVDWDGEKPVMLDQYASGPAIERAWQAASGSQEALPLPAISQRAKSGDDLARAIISDKARRLGLVLAGFVTSLNPAAVIVGGGVPQVGPLWWDAFEAAFRASLPSLLRATPLLPAKLGVEAVVLGAAMLAWRMVEA